MLTLLMAADFLLDLPQHAQAMRSLARLLVGAQDAEDLVQDVALAVLTAAPAPGTWLPAWLRVVLRRQASNRRRTDRRRTRREQDAATADRDAAPDPAQAAAHREALALVTKALLELADPYRDVLFQRFFQDLTPTQIAAATDTPLATVKSRLQRGLDLMRTRVETGLGSDWRKAIGAAFGLDRALVTEAVAATAGAGLLLAGKLLAAAAVAVGAWFAVDAARPAPPTAREVAALPAVTAPADADAEPGATGPADEREVVAGERVLASVSAPVTLRGRCVDAAGHPLAGVELTASMALPADKNGDRTVWREAEPTVERRARTGSDGAFAFTFAARLPDVLELELRGEGLVARSGLWHDVAPGQTVDTGDLAMVPGTRCIGRVVDRDGRPQDDVIVDLRRADDGDTPAASDDDDDVVQSSGAFAVTAADGSFALGEPLPPGDYSVHIEERHGHTPQRVTLDGRSAVQVLELTTEVTTIGMKLAGVVVDARGAPVARASVRGTRGVDTTDAEGRFRMARPAGIGDAVQVTVDAPDFEPWRSPTPLAWGNTDVHIVLADGIALDVAAATADGAPVRAFRLRLARLTERGTMGEERVVGAGEHDDGHLRVPSLRRGRWLLRVEPRDAALEVSAFEPCELSGDAPVHVAVTVPRRAQRTVFLRYPDGAPATGSTVDLVDLCGDRENRYPDEFERWRSGLDAALPRPLLELATATTDAEGSVRFAGPGGVPLALRIRGAGHLAALHDSVVLDEPGPLVVTVRRAGAVAGKATPVEVLRQLRAMAQIEPIGPWEDYAPRVALLRRDGLRVVDRSDGAAGGIDAAGTFAVGGLAPGVWDAVVEYAISSDGRAYATHSHAVGTVVVREGETAALAVDLRALAPGELTGRVLLNGSALADTDGLLVRDEGIGSDGRPLESYHSVHTDAEGRFTAQVPAGQYRLELQDRREMFVPPEQVFVTAGRRAEATFTVAAGDLRLRLLSPQGVPVRGLVPMFEDPGVNWRYVHDVGSDEDGQVSVRLQAGTYEVRVYPRALGTAEQQRAWHDLHGENTPRLLVATIAVAGGATIERELRLPPEWDAR